jgi:signal transduction histidine kinase
MNQSLIQAQEQERSRIARELHDDICQRIAILALQLDILNEDLPATASKLSAGIMEATNRVERLGTDIEQLAHRLHSPKLEYLGLATAAASFCAELSDQQKVKIDFDSQNIPKDLSADSSLCLFRVMQEALQNAIKHSGSRYFQVSLVGVASEIKLTVQDSGIGFEPAEAIKGNGLGLASMRERLKLVDGELSIESRPSKGVTVHARVPVK